MQFAYSLLLGENIVAAEAAYGDCAQYQITCPICREAVFKGERTIPRNIHYFSHYKAKDEARDCEMRVEALACKHGISNGALSHTQTLQSFMTAFQINLISSYEALTGINMLSQVKDIQSRAYFKDFMLFDYMHEMLFAIDGIYTDLQIMLSQVPILKSKSDFWKRRSSAYVIDALRYLKNTQAKSNQTFLVAFSFAVAKDFDNFALIVDDKKQIHWLELLIAVSEARSVSSVIHLKEVALRYRLDIQTSTRKGKACELTFSEKKRLPEVLGLPDNLIDPNMNLDLLKGLPVKTEIMSKLNSAKEKLASANQDLFNVTISMFLIKPFIALLALGSDSYHQKISNLGK